MTLSKDLVSQFVKTTKDDKQTNKKEAFVYGKITDRVEVGEDGKSKYYVKMDGSDIETPVSHFTSIVNTDERVIVMLKNRSAIVTGNVTSVSASTQYVDETINNKIGDVEPIAIEDIVHMWNEYFDSQNK
jgi:hypothetical protein